MSECLEDVVVTIKPTRPVPVGRSKTQHYQLKYHIDKPLPSSELLNPYLHCISCPASTMASYLVTGSTRGIGFQVVTFLASKPTSEVSKIFAAARKENEALKKLIESSSGRVQFVPLEVTSQESVKAAVSTVEVAINGKGLDVLINNAGIANFGPQKYEEM